MPGYEGAIVGTRAPTQRRAIFSKHPELVQSSAAVQLSHCCCKFHNLRLPGDQGVGFTIFLIIVLNTGDRGNVGEVIHVLVCTRNMRKLAHKHNRGSVGKGIHVWCARVCICMRGLALSFLGLRV